jgi:hypothetical protein
LDGVVGVGSLNPGARGGFLGADGILKNDEERGPGFLGGVDGPTGPDTEAAFTFARAERLPLGVATGCFRSACPDILLRGSCRGCTGSGSVGGGLGAG